MGETVGTVGQNCIFGVWDPLSTRAEPTALGTAPPLQFKFLNPVLLPGPVCLHGWCLTQVSNAQGKFSLAVSVGGIKLLTALAAAASPPIFAAVFCPPAFTYGPNSSAPILIYGFLLHIHFVCSLGMKDYAEFMQRH